MKNLIFLLYVVLVCSCMERDLSYYKLSVISDSMNPITEQKVFTGGSLFGWAGLSATGLTACTNCHDESNNYEAPPRSDGTKMIGGCGEGFRLTQDNRLTKVIGYEGKDDCMHWVKSIAAENSAYNKIAGLSGRFGGTDDPQLRQDKIAHFGLENVNPEVLDKLFKCEATLFQAFVALFGHRQLLKSRLFDNPELIVQLEDIFYIKITKDIDEHELAFMVACCLDAYQRTKIRKFKFQDHIDGIDTLSALEQLGYDIVQTKCVGCHESPSFSGGIAESSFPNVEGVPDCANDITGVGILDSTKIYRRVTGFNPDLDLYGPHGEFDNLEGYLGTKNLDDKELEAVAAFIRTN